MKKHIISVLVENHFGVLAHVSGLFSARGFNIDNLSVGETENPDASRMTIVVSGDERVLEQVTKQLNKLIDVIKVVDITSENFVERELLLIKIAVTSSNRPNVMQIIDIFKAKVVDVGPESLTAEVTGGEGKITAAIEMLRPFGIKEMARTGKVAMLREFKGKA